MGPDPTCTMISGRSSSILAKIPILCSLILFLLEPVKLPGIGIAEILSLLIIFVALFQQIWDCQHINSIYATRTIHQNTIHVWTPGKLLSTWFTWLWLRFLSTPSRFEYEFGYLSTDSANSRPYLLDNMHYRMKVSSPCRYIIVIVPLRRVAQRAFWQGIEAIHSPAEGVTLELNDKNLDRERDFKYNRIPRLYYQLAINRSKWQSWMRKSHSFLSREWSIIN